MSLEIYVGWVQWLITCASTYFYMGRHKIPIRKIPDEWKWSITLRRRTEGLFKKAFQLGVLCNVDVYVIIEGRKRWVYSSIDRDYIPNRQPFITERIKGPHDFVLTEDLDDAVKPPQEDRTSGVTNLVPPPPPLKLPVLTSLFSTNRLRWQKFRLKPKIIGL